MRAAPVRTGPGAQRVITPRAASSGFDPASAARSGTHDSNILGAVDVGDGYGVMVADVDAYLDTLTPAGQLLAVVISGESLGLDHDVVFIPDFGGYSGVSGGWSWGIGNGPGWVFTNTNFHGRYWFRDYWTRYPIDGPPGFSLETVAAPVAEPVVELTLLESADAELAYGDAQGAIELYREHLTDDPDDSAAVRSMGLALAVAGRYDDGFALVRLAYYRDAGLARLPVDPYLLGDHGKLRQLLVRSVQRAHRVKTPSAWLTVAVLMQAEGRFEPALRMLERADTLYLEQSIVRALRSELRP